MNFKQFLKPDWRKIVVFIILLIFIVIIIPIFINSGFGVLYVNAGFPLVFYEKTIINPSLGTEKTNFLMLNLVIDIIVLYVLSCLIVWLYDKFRKKK